MENNEDIRWKQRFENYEKAFFKLKEAVDLYAKNANDLEKEGIIQRFEFTHELAWKVMKDFLESKGISGIIGSRDATRHAFKNGIIDEGDHWMEMIESRNKTVHTYQENILIVEYLKIVQTYFNLFSAFYDKMKTL